SGRRELAEVATGLRDLDATRRKPIQGGRAADAVHAGDADILRTVPGAPAVLLRTVEREIHTLPPCVRIARMKTSLCLKGISKPAVHVELERAERRLAHTSL